VRLFDPARSRALLAGTASYRDPGLPTIGSAHANIEALHDLLTGSADVGLPAARCVTLHDPTEPDTLLTALSTAARDATDMLLLYYVGHGLLPALGGDLRLAVAGTVKDHPWTAVSFRDVAAVLHTSRANAKVVILDCCYSGLALQTVPFSPGRRGIHGTTDTEGLYVLTATAADWTALGRDGAVHTAFTAALLAVLRNGLPADGDLLPLNAVYGEVRSRLILDGCPHPQKEERNAAGDLALVRNRAYRGSGRTQRSLDLSLSCALLVGTDTYRDHRLPPLPAATNGVRLLAEVLQDPRICGIPATQCVQLENPDTPTDLLARLRAAADSAEDELIVYLSGRAVLDADDGLTFPMRASDLDQPRTMLTPADLADTLRSARSRSTIVIVDAAFSGRLAAALAGLPNTATLTSSGPHHLGKIVDDQGAFTTAIIRLLRNGLARRPRHLTVFDVFEGLIADPHAAWPHLSTSQLQRLYCLFHNLAPDADPDAPHPCTGDAAPASA
jgi:uncharacterized caspase-like protein